MYVGLYYMSETDGTPYGWHGNVALAQVTGAAGLMASAALAISAIAVTLSF